MIAAGTTDGVSWTTVVVGALVGGAVVLGIVALAIVLLGTPRGHPPLAHQ